MPRATSGWSNAVRGRGVHMQVLKFTNDGSEIVMQLGDGDDPATREEARANPAPGPFDYGDPAVLAFLPDGSFLLGDGYWNSRIIKYDADGNYLMEFGEQGTGPGQFDLIHGLAIDRAHRVYVADRRNNRIQIFTEDGEFIEEWPDIIDPTGVLIDEQEAVWVIFGQPAPGAQVQHRRRTAAQLGCLWWRRRTRGRAIPPSPDRRGRGRQCLHCQLVRRVVEQVHPQAGRRPRHAHRQTPLSSRSEFGRPYGSESGRSLASKLTHGTLGP